MGPPRNRTLGGNRVSVAHAAPVFLGWVRARVARIAIGASTARNQGGAGVVEKARKCVAHLDLAAFGTGSEQGFTRALAAATDRMRRALPGSSGTFGLSRKLVNIFLRDSLYTCYLRDRYGL